MQKNIFFAILMIFVSSVYSAQSIMNSMRQAAKQIKIGRFCNFSSRGQSQKTAEMAPMGRTTFFQMPNRTNNFVSLGVKPLVKSSFLTNMRDRAVQLWHKFGIMERYFFPVIGARILPKDRQFALATQEVVHSIIETEKEYKNKLQDASNDQDKIEVIKEELNSIIQGYDSYGLQITLFPYNEISYLRAVIYHVYTAKLLYQMKQNILSIKENTGSIFELEGEMQELLEKINSELKRLQEFFDNQYKHRELSYDENQKSGIYKAQEKPKKVVIFSDDIDFASQFNELGILNYFMEKVFNVHDREVVSLVLKNTVWFDREKNNFYEKVRQVKDSIGKIKVSIGMLQSLENQNNLISQDKRNSSILVIVDNMFCRKERDDFAEKVRGSIKLFTQGYQAKMAEEYEELYQALSKDDLQLRSRTIESLEKRADKLRNERRNFPLVLNESGGSIKLFIQGYQAKMAEEYEELYQALSKDDLQLRSRTIESLEKRADKLRNERRNFPLVLNESEGKLYLDPFYCEKLVNKVTYEKLSSLIEKLKVLQN